MCVMARRDVLERELEEHETALQIVFGEKNILRVNVSRRAFWNHHNLSCEKFEKKKKKPIVDDTARVNLQLMQKFISMWRERKINVCA